MTMTDIDTPAAWVGCLGCYNDGDLVGKWLSDPDEIRAYRCPRPTTIYNAHEELWVMDHEHMPLISGECSPVEFADAIEFVDGLDRWHPVEAVKAWLDDRGDSWRDFDSDEFEDDYAGFWDSEEEYAEQFADDCGLIERDATWPNSYIDWERAARDLFMTDMWSHPADGGIYAFRRS